MVPSKVAFFCLLVFLENILTADNLRKHGLFVVDWCLIYKKDVESFNYLFFHYEVAKTLWDEILGERGIVWMMPKQVLDILAC